MNRRAPCVLASIVVILIAAFPAAADTVSSCIEAAGLVEQRLGLPHGLLRSIGQVETGNHPWSVESDGAGARFASADDAAAFVRRAAGTPRFVDVGCFQIDLAYHPTTFKSLEEAFDPVANATAAGEFLLSLRRGTSSWSDAVARYHSAQPERGSPYAARVYASLGMGASLETDTIAPVAGIRIIVPAAFETVGAGRHVDGPGLPVVQTP